MIYRIAKQRSRISAGPDPARLVPGLILGLIAVAAQLALVWGFEYFPTVDGPAHVHLAHAMYQSIRGDAFYRLLVEFNSQFNPNILAQSVLIALMVIAPPFVAEKLWLSLYFVSFAAAAGYAAYGISKSSLCLLPLFIFCSISFGLAFGFYNFSFSTVVFLAWFGYWWRHRHSPSIGIALGHAAFALGAYVTHVFALIVALLAFGVIVLASAALAIGSHGKDVSVPPRGWRTDFWSQTLPLLLGSLPAIAASLHFLVFRVGSDTAAGAASLAMPHPDRLVDLLTGATFAPYDSSEIVVATAFVVVVLLMLVRMMAAREGTPAGGPLAICLVAFLVLYLVMPDRWIVRWMPLRFLPLVFVVSLLWLAALTPVAIRRAQWWTISGVGLAILMASVVVRAGIFVRLDGLYREYSSAAPHIAENSALIGLRLLDSYQNRPFPAKVDVFIQAGSRLASMRHSIDVKNFQGQSNDHPVQFRPGVSATRSLGGDGAITAAPPRIQLMEYERQTGRAIDYVLLYGFREAVENKTALARLDAQLEADYRLVYVSQPRGFVHLYARASSSSARGPDLDTGRSR